MKVGLIQVDGKWMNLALMKISAWHKNQGHSVEWYRPLWDYDVVYASKIFTDSPDYSYMPADTVKAGSGYSLTLKLPEEIEQTFPDYSLYPKVDYAIGFTTRGCPRKCGFCIVPKKEGNLTIVGDINNFWNGQKLIRLLDNNLTAAPTKHFKKIMEQLRETDARVEFSQGLDLRLLSGDHCEALKDIRLGRQIHFAWDWMKDEHLIKRGLELYREIVKDGAQRLYATVYVLIGYNTTQEEDLYRVEKLRKMGADPYVMKFGKRSSYKTNFSRWVNRKAIFKSISWKDYKRFSFHA